MGAWLLVLVVVLLPGVAAGQSEVILSVPGAPSEGRPQPPSPTIPAGPTAPVPPPPPTAVRPIELRPTVAVSEEWTDNFHRSERDTRSNFRSMLSPGLAAFLNYGSLSGFASYTLSAFHDTLSDEPGVFNTLFAQGAWQAASRIRLSAVESFIQHDEPSLADRLNLRHERRKFTANTLNLAADVGVAGLDTREYYRLATFSSENGRETTAHTIGTRVTVPLYRINTASLGYEYLDSETEAARNGGATGIGDFSITGHQWTATFQREVTARFTAGLTGAYALRHQDREDGESDFSRWTVALTGNYLIPDTIHVSASLGVGQLEGRGSSGDLLLITETNITYWLGPATLALAIERGFSETFAETENQGVVETTGVTGSVRYQFTALLATTAKAGYRLNSFTGVGGGIGDRDETVLTADLAVTFQIARWLGSTLEYRFTDTSASGLASRGRSFTENLVRASLTASF